MSVSVLMPQLGESVTEGTAPRGRKKEGEQVTADEPLLEVSTDKVDTEIPAPASGILRGIVVDEDETVAVGAQLAVIEDADAPAATAALPAARSRPRRVVRAVLCVAVVRPARARFRPGQRRAVRVRQLVVERAGDAVGAVLRSPRFAGPGRVRAARAVVPAAGLTRPGGGSPAA